MCRGQSSGRSVHVSAEECRQGMFGWRMLYVCLYVPVCKKAIMQPSEGHILFWWLSLSLCVCVCVRLSNSWPCLSFSWLSAVFARCHLGVWPQIKTYLTVIIVCITVCMWVTQWPHCRGQNHSVCVDGIRTAYFPSSLPFSVSSPRPLLPCSKA